MLRLNQANTNGSYGCFEGCIRKSQNQAMHCGNRMVCDRSKVYAAVIADVRLWGSNQ
jgi:hypothetical protein